MTSFKTALLRAHTVTGRDGNRAEALPREKTVEILRRYGAIKDSK